MQSAKIIEILIGAIDKEARTSVGILCAEIESLEKEKSLSSAQIISLFKSLAKNTVYEQSRVLKKLLRAMSIPSIVFVSKKSKEN